MRNGGRVSRREAHRLATADDEQELSSSERSHYTSISLESTWPGLFKTCSPPLAGPW